MTSPSMPQTAEGSTRPERPCAVRERVFARRGLVLDPGDALFLDFDGTLVDIAATPDAITVPRTLVPLLGDLQVALDGAIALVTGRPIADIDRFIAPLRLSVAGVHGAEIRLLPSELVLQTTDPVDELVHQRVADAVADISGVRLEIKGASIAVHYRDVPRAAGLLEARLQAVSAHEAERLVLVRGRRVFEIMARSVSKGTALTDFAAHPPFVGRRPVMIGDDVSDESAFVAAERIGGAALRVGGEHFGPGLADFIGPEDVRAWLTDFLRRNRR